MEKIYAVSFYLLLTVGAVTAQTAKPQERVLPQWITGLIAVTGFLFLAFVSVLLKKAWCDEPRKRSSPVPVNENNIEESPYDSIKDSMRRTSPVPVNEYNIEESPYDSIMDSMRKTDKGNGYDNQTFESTEEKVTTM